MPLFGFHHRFETRERRRGLGHIVQDFGVRFFFDFGCADCGAIFFFRRRFLQLGVRRRVTVLGRFDISQRVLRARLNQDPAARPFDETFAERRRLTSQFAQTRRPGFGVALFRFSQPIQNVALFFGMRVCRQRAIRLRSGDLALPRFS